MNDEHAPYLTTIAENLNLQRALIRSLDSIGGVEILDNIKVSSIQKDSENGGWPIVHTSNGSVLRARLLVSCIASPETCLFNVLLFRSERTDATLRSGRMLA